MVDKNKVLGDLLKRIGDIQEVDFHYLDASLLGGYAHAMEQVKEEIKKMIDE